MFNRKTIATVVLAATAGIATPVFATGDAGVNHAQRLLEEARNFGKSTTGQAAGETRRDREQRREAQAQRGSNEQRWQAILKAQSLN